MQIAGIDTYAGYNGVEHHIDWISKDCLEEAIAWNSSGTNNGVYSTGSVVQQTGVSYYASDIYTYLNNEIESYIPDEVNNVVTTKYLPMETRTTSSDEDLTDSTSITNVFELGKYWIPSEYEVIGSTECGTRRFSSTGFVQYPLFTNSVKNRIKNVTWWLSTPVSGSSTSAVSINTYGVLINSTVTRSFYIPLCFRIATTS